MGCHCLLRYNCWGSFTLKLAERPCVAGKGYESRRCVLKLGVFPASGCADGEIGIDSVEKRVAEALSEGVGTSGFPAQLEGLLQVGP